MDMTRDEARRLFGYGSWANRLMFGAARALPEDHLRATVVSSFPSVLATLAHVVSAEWIWLQRWLGDNPAGVPPWAAEPALADLENRLSAVERERDTFLAESPDADMARVVSYRTLAGQPYADPLGDLVRHVVNHSTYHRGQVATQLRQLGHTPPGTDMIRYLREAR